MEEIVIQHLLGRTHVALPVVPDVVNAHLGCHGHDNTQQRHRYTYDSFANHAAKVTQKTVSKKSVMLGW